MITVRPPGVVLRVHERFFPRGKRLKSLHEGFAGWTISAVNSARPAAATGRRRAMTSDWEIRRRRGARRAVAGVDEVAERLLLRGVMASAIAVDHHGVVVRELRRSSASAGVRPYVSWMPRRASGAASSGNIFDGLCGRLLVGAEKEHLDRLPGRRGRRTHGALRRRLARLGQKRQAAERQHGRARHRRPRQSQPGTMKYHHHVPFARTDITSRRTTITASSGGSVAGVVDAPGTVLQSAPAVM